MYRGGLVLLLLSLALLKASFTTYYNTFQLLVLKYHRVLFSEQHAASWNIPREGLIPR